VSICQKNPSMKLASIQPPPKDPHCPPTAPPPPNPPTHPLTRTKPNQPKTPQTKGFTFELCAGLVDKGGKSLAQITAEEVEEECGYKVAAEKLQSVASAISSSGTTGSEHYIYFGVVSGGWVGLIDWIGLWFDQWLAT